MTGQSAPARTATNTRVSGLTAVRGSENRTLPPTAATAVISAPHKYIVSTWVTPFCSWQLLGSSVRMHTEEYLWKR